MQLMYRGISYQSTSIDIANFEQKTNSKYGKTFSQQQKAKVRTITDISVLKYRSTEYIKIINH
ncbi:MAG: DUF4278 domain-containing protein [Cyanobacteria bacterium P01_A01_bin.40]